MKNEDGSVCPGEGSWVFNTRGWNDGLGVAGVRILDLTPNPE